MPSALHIREFVTETGATDFAFTELALEELKTLAKVGFTPEQVAQFFDMPEDWVKKQLSFGQAKSAFQMNDAAGKLELATAMHEMAKAGDSRVAVHLAKQRLGHVDKKTVDVTKTITVIGATPNLSMSSDEWARKYVPQEVQHALPPPIEAPPAQQTAEAVDAEIIEESKPE